MDQPSRTTAFGSGRVTRARREIASAIESAAGVFTVDDLAAILRARGSAVGLATIYRAMTAMEDAGSVERVGSRGTTALYTHCETSGHHHHVVCTSCGKVAPTTCPLDAGALAGLARRGFEITGHDIVLYGLCPECSVATGGDD